ncbi:hypothetical protein AX774_g1275 [Zancudomyces culisetae]|uniref:Chitin-binding type-2 domain-containing protein n=1 Tax=Zancudomyces culisetae TaxID=1213189 RepID=A0A1R1PW77_ZANCU|nr:hypothetical protein AX774_g1275 [Zancudomyces culisetae]|eukprot:OMH85174.1 hypothetical protein AX774_g1275 [Zancudomyces culisetae]
MIMYRLIAACALLVSAVFSQGCSSPDYCVSDTSMAVCQNGAFATIQCPQGLYCSSRRRRVACEARSDNNHVSNGAQTTNQPQLSPGCSRYDYCNSISSVFTCRNGVSTITNCAAGQYCVYYGNNLPSCSNTNLNGTLTNVTTNQVVGVCTTLLHNIPRGPVMVKFFIEDAVPVRFLRQLCTDISQWSCYVSNQIDVFP